MHGGNGGDSNFEINVPGGVYVTKLWGEHDGTIRKLGMALSNGQSFGAWGRSSGSAFFIERTYCKLAFFTGYAGVLFDNFVVYWIC